RLEVALAAPHRERAGAAQQMAQYGIEQLDLGHEVELPSWPERHAERPRIEARVVVRSEHEAPARRQPVDALDAKPVGAVDGGPGERGDDVVGGGRHRAREYRLCDERVTGSGDV